MILNTTLKMQQKAIKALIIIAVSFFLGFYACILFKKFSVLSIGQQVAIEINPFEIITTVITILLAIYVTRFLGKKNDLEKSEKEAFKLYLIEFKKLASEKIYKIIEKDDFSALSTNSDLKILRKKINTILNLGKEFGYIEDNDVLSTALNCSY